MSLNSFQENATRLGMRLQETISEHTRDLNFGRPSGVTFFDTSEDKVKNLRKQLESSLDSDKLEAMKRLIAMISKGRNVSEFFAQVVKNVASRSLEIRKLVYIYLLRYTEQEPDLALLSINTFQKDLSDPNPFIRSMALRVLSGIKVPMIGSLVVLGIKKCAADPNPYVRKAAALAIPKLISIDSSHLSALEPTMVTLLRDTSPVSIGYVAETFNVVFSHRLELLHEHYRRLCRILVDVDEWGQIFLMNLLLRYAKQMLPKPKVGEEDKSIDSDLLLLLDAVEPLFQSRNPAVVMTSCRVCYGIRGQSSLMKVIPSLLRLSDSEPSPEIRRIILSYISILATESPGLRAHSSRFYVRTRDPSPIKTLKLKILLQLASSENVFALLRELKEYCLDTDDAFAAKSMRAIGRCATIVPDSIQQSLNILIDFIQSPYDLVVGNAVMVLKSLIQARRLASDLSSNLTKSLLKVIERLACHIEDIRHPEALACSLWLIGQYADGQDVGIMGPSDVDKVADWAPDALRKMAKSFSNESSIVKLQIISLAAKLRVLDPHHISLEKLSRYIFSLARFDADYDVRDRARMLSSLLLGLSADSEALDRGGVVLRRQQIKAILFLGKSYAVEDGASEASSSNILGSLGPLLGRAFFETNVSPDWLEQGVDPALRETKDEVHQSGVFVQRSVSIAHQSSQTPVALTPVDMDSPIGSYVQRSKWNDLDKFYASDENGADEDEDEDEGESEGEDENEDDDEEGDEESGEDAGDENGQTDDDNEEQGHKEYMGEEQEDRSLESNNQGSVDNEEPEWMHNRRMADRSITPITESRTF